MDEEKERNKLLLELAFHRYEEEEKRNQLIDSKNKSFVAFLGVMLTLQSTIAPKIIELYCFVPWEIVSILLFLFVLSLIFYGIALGFFTSTLLFINKFQAAPKIISLIYFGKECTDVDFIIQNTIVSLNQCVLDNDELLKDKSKKGNLGLNFIIVGVLFTIIFIIFYLLIVYWCYYV